MCSVILGPQVCESIKFSLVDEDESIKACIRNECNERLLSSVIYLLIWSMIHVNESNHDTLSIWSMIHVNEPMRNTIQLKLNRALRHTNKICWVVYWERETEKREREIGEKRKGKWTQHVYAGQINKRSQQTNDTHSKGLILCITQGVRSFGIAQ